MLDCIETDCTVFYSAGGTLTRTQKLKELSIEPYAQKHLHPCIYATRKNCGSCGKCIRTMTALYAIGTLSQFRDSFDVDRFYREKDNYIAHVIAGKQNRHCSEALYEMEKNGITISDRARQKAKILKAAVTASKKMNDTQKEY